MAPHEFLRWAYLEGADFAHMAMTRRGTVLYEPRDPVLFADREALDSGPMRLCTLNSNGRVGFSSRAYAFSLLEAKRRRCTRLSGTTVSKGKFNWSRAVFT